MNLKVGEICVLVDCIPERLVGTECVITGPEDWYHNVKASRSGIVGPFFGYRIEIAGEKFLAERRTLRPKRPPAWDSWLTDTTNIRDEIREGAQA